MRKFTKDMKEISGFGGSYEKKCRDMVLAGLDWFDKHPEANPQYHEYENVIGICREDNEDAKLLSEYITKDMDCTGAQHHAAIFHIFRVLKVGWDKYVEEMKELKLKQMVKNN